MTTTISLPPRQYNYITPALPEDGQEDEIGWNKLKRGPALRVAFDYQYHTQCKNCNGLGKVMLRLCDGGPYSTPNSTKKVVTWFDGNLVWRKGYYVVKETKIYTCPLCKGTGEKVYEQGELT